MTDKQIGLNEMSLRDFFAAQAINGLINWGTFGGGYEPSLFAQEAYAIADEMMKARNVED